MERIYSYHYICKIFDEFEVVLDYLADKYNICVNNEEENKVICYSFDTEYVHSLQEKTLKEKLETAFSLYILDIELEDTEQARVYINEFDSDFMNAIQELKIRIYDNWDLSKEELARSKFNMKLLVDKKPYFFIYNYNNLRTEYNTWKTNVNKQSIMQFAMKYCDLQAKEYKTEEEKNFIKYAESICPIFDNDCVVNRICHKLEDEFADIEKKVKDDSNFDYSIYKSKNVKRISSKVKDSVEEILKEYKLELKNLSKRISENSVAEEEKCRTLEEHFRQKLASVCPNEEMLTNIILDLTYGQNKDKSIAWKLVGQGIIDNLLQNNDYTYKIPLLDEDGDIEWNGDRFKIVEIKAEEECNINE